MNVYKPLVLEGCLVFACDFHCTSSQGKLGLHQAGCSSGRSWVQEGGRCLGTELFPPGSVSRTNGDETVWGAVGVWVHLCAFSIGGAGLWQTSVKGRQLAIHTLCRNQRLRLGRCNSWQAFNCLYLPRSDLCAPGSSLSRRFVSRLAQAWKG